MNATTPAEKIVLTCIKIFGLLLILAGAGFIFSPVYFAMKPGLVTQGGPASPLFGKQILYIAIVHAIAGGYLVLTGLGYWQKKIWGPMCGILLFVLALMLGAKGFNEALPDLTRAAYLGGGLVFCLLYLLPFIVWKHFYDVEKT